jgi:peptide deformylase
LDQIPTPANDEIPPGKILPIVVGDLDILTKPCVEFDFENPTINPLQLASDLVATMISKNGLGLAANQVNHPWRVFAMRTAPKMTVAFNPKIVNASGDQVVLEEGCLSFPDYVVKIKRPEVIRLRLTYPNGETVTETFKGMTARVVQHEIDHLDGILFWKRANKFHRDQADRKYDKRVRNRVAHAETMPTDVRDQILTNAKKLGTTILSPNGNPL